MKKQNDTRDIIASRLKTARERSGLSQANAAAEMGLSRPSVSEIEAGKRKVSADELVKFSDLYSVDINWLAGRGTSEVDPLRDKLQLAAREVANLKKDDLEKVIDLLVSLKPGDDK